MEWLMDPTQGYNLMDSMIFASCSPQCDCPSGLAYCSCQAGLVVVKPPILY